MARLNTLMPSSSNTSRDTVITNKIIGQNFWPWLNSHTIILFQPPCILLDSRPCTEIILDTKFSWTRNRSFQHPQLSRNMPIGWQTSIPISDQKCYRPKLHMQNRLLTLESLLPSSRSAIKYGYCADMWRLINPLPSLLTNTLENFESSRMFPPIHISLIFLRQWRFILSSTYLFLSPPLPTHYLARSTLLHHQLQSKTNLSGKLRKFWTPELLEKLSNTLLIGLVMINLPGNLLISLGIHPVLSNNSITPIQTGHAHEPCQDEWTRFSFQPDHDPRWRTSLARARP